MSENELIVPSRRGFLGLALCAIAAPAVIRVAELMPINPRLLHTYGPNGLLTIEQLTKEALRLWGEAYKQILANQGDPVTMVEIGDTSSAYTEKTFAALTTVSSRQRRDSLENFSARVLEPMISPMKKSWPKNLSMAEFRELPHGVLESHTVGGVRALYDYDIASDRMVLQIAVRGRVK